MNAERSGDADRTRRTPPTPSAVEVRGEASRTGKDRSLRGGTAQAAPDYFARDPEEGRGEERADDVIRPEAQERDWAIERSRRRPPGSVWWLIAKTANGRVEVLTLDRGGEETLPVFSHAEEAEMFLRLGAAGGGWRVRESCANELFSVLRGPRAGVERVALDPLPEMVAQRTVGLVSLSRERFLGRVVAPGRGPDGRRLSRVR